MTRSGPVTCVPAFEPYAALCREYPPERVAPITGVPAAPDRRDRAPALGAPARLLLPLDRPRAAHQREPDRAGPVAPLRADRHLRRARRQRAPSRPGVNDLAPLSLLSDTPARQGPGPRRAPPGPGPLGLGDGRRHTIARSCTARHIRCGAWSASAPTCSSPSRTRPSRARRSRGSTSSSTPISSSRRPRRWPTWSCRYPPPGSARACA